MKERDKIIGWVLITLSIYGAISLGVHIYKLVTWLF